MSDNPAQIPLRLAIDEQALARSQQGLALLSQKLADLRKNAQDTGVTTDKAAQALGDGVAKATPLMDRLAASAEKAALAAKNASGNWNDLRDSIFSAGKASSEASSKFGAEGLRRTGGALTQLGFGAIGGPVSQIGDIAQVGKELGQVSKAFTDMTGATEPLIGGLSAGTVAMGALAAAGLVLVGGLALIRAEYEKNNAVVKEAISRLDTYYEAIATGDKKSIQSKLDQLKVQQDTAQKELEVIKAARERGFDAAVKQYGDFGARILTALGSTGLYGDALKDTSAKQDELTKKMADTEGQIKGLTDALNSDAIAAQAATDAVLKNADAVGKQVAESLVDSKLSFDAAKQKKAALLDEYQAISAELVELQTSGDQSQAVKDKIAELTAKQKELLDETYRLTETIIPAAKAQQDYTDAVKEHSKSLEDANKAAVEAAKAEDKRLSDIAASYQKYENDIANITRAGAEREAEIHKQLADKLVDEATKMVQEAQDDLQKLQDKRAELFTNLQRGEVDAQSKAAYDQLTAQIHSQEATQKAYQDHLNRLQDIQRSEWANEQQALLDRNFVALAKSRLNVATQTQGENINFGRSERDRLAQEQSSRQDTQRQMAFEHQQRLVAYERANQDALTQYNIELRNQKIAGDRAAQQAQLAAQRELAAEQQKTQAALKLRQQQALAELRVMQQGGEARVKLEAQIQAALVSQAMRFLRTGGTSTAPVSFNASNDRLYAGDTRAVQLTQTNNISNATDGAAIAQLIQRNTISVLQRVLQ